MSDTADSKATLLRALDEVDLAIERLGDGAEVRHLCVVYSVGRKLDDGAYHEDGGWCSTSDPSWLHSALLRRAAAFLDNAATDDDEGDDEDEGDD